MPPITPMIKNLIFWNVGIWLLQTLSPGLFQSWDGVPLFTVNLEGLERGYLWQPFTYMWLHEPNFPLHVMMNMFALYMFGTQLETLWGPRRFLRFYIICGVGAGVLIGVCNWIFDERLSGGTLGASGAVFGVLTAYALLWPNKQVMLLFPPIPIKAIWLIPTLFIMLYLFPGNGEVSHVAHLGGVLVGAALLRDETRQALNIGTLRQRWNRYRMRGRLRAVRRDEWERRRRGGGGDDDRPTYH
jgi:membrane associated rhomboid family serine protease